MATIALMIGGAILNATAFIGGSYLEKSLSGTNSDAERKRHDEALEKYQKDWAKCQKKKQEFEAWEEKRSEGKNLASQNFKNTDEALKYYNEAHEEFDPVEPNWSDYYRPGVDQKRGELIYVGGEKLVLGWLASKWF